MSDMFILIYLLEVGGMKFMKQFVGEGYKSLGPSGL
jgi:hypothetical protein